MEIVFDEEDLLNYFREAVVISPDHPILLDKFMENAIEIDVDAVSDGEETYVGGIMEHIEEAGIHSGDSACVLPPHTIGPDMIEELKRQTRALARELQVKGLMNIQFAIKDGDIYILEVNPRASRTVPFVSKATGVPLAKLATRVMLGERLADLGLTEAVVPAHISVKEAVMPFTKFPGVDTLLGPEMKSTGEVMGIDTDFGQAFAKAQLGAGQALPVTGTVFISVNDSDKQAVLPVARQFAEIGFALLATRGTADFLTQNGLAVTFIHKVSTGRPHVVDAIINNEIQFIINTGTGNKPRQDGYKIRRAALKLGIPYTTTIAGARAMGRGVAAMARQALSVTPLQHYHHSG